MHQQKNCIDPSEGVSRSLVESMHKQKNRIDPNAGVSRGLVKSMWKQKAIDPNEAIGGVW
jgi:hypothetical protein